MNVFGINCSMGPDVMVPAIEWSNRNTIIPIIMIPDADLPENKQGCTV